MFFRVAYVASLLIENEACTVCRALVPFLGLGLLHGLNLRKKLSLQRKRVSHPLKIRVLKVATALLEIMVINVVLSKTIKCHVL